MPRPLLNDDACALLDASDATDEQPSRRELRLERSASLGRQRDEEPARGLRVVRQRFERLVDTVRPHVRAREVAVARIPAGADAVACEIKGAVDRREPRGLEPDADAAAIGHLVRVAEKSEA